MNDDPDDIVDDIAHVRPEKPEWQRTIRAIICPDCGPVRVWADVFDAGESISGECPICGDRLYFQRHVDRPSTEDEKLAR